MLCAEPLDMGRVAIGSIATGTMVVTNCGQDAVDVTASGDVDQSSQRCGLRHRRAGQTLPASLAPNETIDVPVRLTASAVGTKDGWVHVTSTSPEHAERVLPRDGRGRGHLRARHRADPPDLPQRARRQLGAEERPHRELRSRPLRDHARGDHQRRNGLLAARSLPVPRDLASGFSDLLAVRYRPTLPGRDRRGRARDRSRDARAPDRSDSATRRSRLDVSSTSRPDYINFGTVPGGDSVIRQVEIQNIGLADCTSRAPSSTLRRALRSRTSPRRSARCPPDKRPLRSSPSARSRPERDSGTLRLTTSDVDSPVFEIGLFGATSPPGICVAPRDVDFGMTMNGIETFRIWTCGAQPVRLTDLTFSRPDDEFTLDAPPALPAILQPNEERTISVHYISNDDVGDSAVITVGSNDPVDPLIRVNVVAGPVIVPPSAGRYLYYWQIDSFSGDESNIVRMPLQGAPIPENFWGPRNGKPCSGCHGVARTAAMSR